MPDVTLFHRRQFLAGAAALGSGAALATAAPGEAGAKAEMKGPAGGVFSRYVLGGFEVTTLLDGARTMDSPQNIFGMNVDAEAFSQASVLSHISPDRFRLNFTPTIVNTGNELVLFDTGLGGNGNIVGALAAAGYTPDQVDVVVITHMHPDHIGGMMTEGKPTFPNARYVTGEAEYGFWTTKGKDNRVGKLVASNVTPLAEKLTFLKDGGSVVSGITAMEAFGHTPGHMTYMIESNGQQLVLIADLANHHVWSLAHPDWEVKFDADKEAAAAARRRILSLIAVDKLPFIGYHMPFPSLGFVETRGSGFHYIPATYQLKMTP